MLPSISIGDEGRIESITYLIKACLKLSRTIIFVIYRRLYFILFYNKANLLDNLLVFLRTELFNAPKEHITDYLFLLQYLIRHVLDVRTLQPQIIQFLAELFIVFSNPANLN